MLKTKKILKITAIILVTAVVLLFTAFNVYWLAYYNKFKILRENSSVNEGHTLGTMGTLYTYSDHDTKISYSTVSPGYLKTYGNVSIGKQADINSLVHESAYDVSIQVRRTMFTKQYIVHITYLEDSSKTGPDTPAQKFAQIYVDENMNIINPDNYSKEELAHFDDCEDIISELYEKLNNFFGKDNVMKL